MAKGTKVTKGLDEMFGVGIMVSEFLDGKERELKPVTLTNFKKFMDSVMVINSDTLWTNFLSDEGMGAIRDILELSFSGCDVDELVDNINAKNFPIIFDTIMKSNGINLKNEEGSGEEGKQ